jgi:hypothetical protein
MSGEARAALRRVMAGRGTLDDVDLVERTLDRAEALVSVLRELRPLVIDGPRASDQAFDLITAALKEES